MTDKDFPYADILHLPHHRAAGRAHMSLHDRAAQFAPFAALTGFDGVIAETGRQTECRVELSESETVLLDRKLARIIESLQQGQHPTVTVETWRKKYKIVTETARKDLLRLCECGVLERTMEGKKAVFLIQRN